MSDVTTNLEGETFVGLRNRRAAADDATQDVNRQQPPTAPSDTQQDELQQPQSFSTLLRSFWLRIVNFFPFLGRINPQYYFSLGVVYGIIVLLILFRFVFGSPIDLLIGDVWEDEEVQVYEETTPTEGRLPGDIVYEGEGLLVYFPFLSFLLLSKNELTGRIYISKKRTYFSRELNFLITNGRKRVSIYAIAQTLTTNFGPRFWAATGIRPMKDIDSHRESTSKDLPLFCTPDSQQSVPVGFFMLRNDLPRKLSTMRSNIMCFRVPSSGGNNSPHSVTRHVPVDLPSIPGSPLHPSQYVSDKYIADPDRPPAITPTPGFRVELGSALGKHDVAVELENQLENGPTYQHTYLNEDHFNFVSINSPNEPVIASIKAGRNRSEVMGLVRTRKRDYHVTVPSNKSRSVMMAAIRAKIPDIGQVQMKEVRDAALKQDLAHLEDRLTHKHYKIGVIYCKEGQTLDDQMFSNSTGSPDFERFLNLIGDVVPLKGYKGYDGELDVKTDTTGLNSVATEIAGYEVMYHVSTMLPFSTVNMQQIERKRHIGNDVVVIIFQDGDRTPFIPSSIASKFNHVYIVVQVVKNDPTLPSESPFSSVVNCAPIDGGDTKTKQLEEDRRVRYRVAAVSKSGVSPFGPLIPANSIFYHGREFREFLLTKAVNAERASYGAPSFALYRTRRDWLKDIISKVALIRSPEVFTANMLSWSSYGSTQCDGSLRLDIHY
ncbi:hypothetical protein PROFUN_03311 [Planoprotostelium fungivorum]|uniref:Rap-GAP domain-containing protein n=1 Tax=Planoprotostelium fungivorum TaxID=1890364 RepID=A0A2P6NWR4_9EUKA|nr:hypothetical protein PROFUN_03311 [Planoprotostelium fungivorum]